MTDFSIRSDSVDVEQIMQQIRARIREKRGVDYTESEIRELATVKLEKFLDPRGVRSDLLEQFRRSRPSPETPLNYAFEDTTIFDSHRAILRGIRALLRPILKLFFNPTPLSHVLHLQAEINTRNAEWRRKREEIDPLYYEVMHNLVVEMTRLGIEVKNLKMRVESLSSRLDFDERRARALEGVVQYRPGATPLRPQPTGGASETAEGAGAVEGRRRRRRRGRRRGPGAPAEGSQLASPGGQTAAPAQRQEPASAPEPRSAPERESSES